jgi:copper chaperone CopZ
MNGFTSRTLRYLAPFLGVALFSGLASAKIVTESWQIKGVHSAADEGKVRFALAQLPSVTNPVVMPSLVRVTFDDQKLQNAQIEQAVAKAGRFELIGKPMLADTVPNSSGANTSQANTAAKSQR